MSYGKVSFLILFLYLQMGLWLLVELKFGIACHVQNILLLVVEQYGVLLENVLNIISIIVVNGNCQLFLLSPGTEID